MPKYTAIGEAKAIAEQTWAYEMRLQGMTERQIHAAFPIRFGYSISLTTVHRRLKAERVERVALRDEKRDELIQRELDLIDRRLLNLERIATGKQEVEIEGRVILVPYKAEQIIAAENTILRLSAERRKLLGLDAPTEAKLEVTTVDPTDLELVKLVEQMKAEDKKAGKKKRKKGKARL